MMNRGMMNPILYSNDTPQPVGAGIYENTDLGLLSLSTNGTNWITIKNKDIIKDGMYTFFQRGNNYGFPPSPSLIDSIQVDATNYGPYYESDTFIDPQDEPYDWSSVRNDNLWGFNALPSSNIAKQGPCPEGFHIPHSEYYYGDMWILEYIMSRFGFQSYIEYATYLKMPRPTLWSSYRCCDTTGVDAKAYQRIADDNGITEVEMNRSSFNMIRPFYNTHEIPDETREQLYDYGGRGGIYHNPSLGLISIYHRDAPGDGWITIADKNLGATEVYNYGDTPTQANCGNFYQRGNNYGFPFTGPTKTSTTLVDATNYGPYYNRGVFITNDTKWTSVDNNNLRGGVTNTNKAMRGPCDEGYHIPTSDEFTTLKNIMGGFGLTLFEHYYNYLHMPRTDFLDGTSGRWIGVGNSRGRYRSSDGKCFITYSNTEPYIGDSRKTDGYCIRPFKNEPVTPDGTRNKLY